MNHSIVLFGHGGSYNHGCEAIVRSTLEILKNDLPEVHLYTNSVSSDLEFGLDKLAVLHEQRRPFQIKNPIDLTAMVFKKILHSDSLYLKRFFAGKMDSVKNSLCISIGGDMYCYGKIPWLYYIHKILRQNNNKTLLWGCSVNEDSFFEEAKQDFMRYDRILTRESISLSLFEKNGLKNVVLYPDPAFTLPLQKTDLPPSFAENNTIGINISPLMNRYKGNSPLDANVDSLIQYLLNETAYQILLIPHVNGAAQQEDDYGFLKELMLRYPNAGNRIALAGRNLNCCQLKYIISLCRFLVTARTHASIAAYSTHVPTLVLGYSTKSRGIARDIFGQEEQYVLPVNALKSENELTNNFLWLQENEKNIREHLTGFMPDYIKRAYLSEKEIQKLCAKP